MQVRVFNATSLFSKFWNTEVLSNKTEFNGVYSKNNLLKMKDGTFLINFDKFKLIRTRWIAFYVNDNNVTCFDSFGVEHNTK